MFQNFKPQGIYILFIIAIVLLIIVLAAVILIGFSSQSPTPTNKQQKPLSKEEIEAQVQSDKEFGDYWKRVYTSYPWYNKLPLHGKNYFVYFDPEKKLFTGKLYPLLNAKISVNQQVEGLKQGVLQQLESFGVDTKEFEFSWDIKPENRRLP